RDRVLVGLGHEAGEARLGAANLLLDVAPAVDVERGAIGIRSDEQRIARQPSSTRPCDDRVADAVAGDPEHDERPDARGDAVMMALGSVGVDRRVNREGDRRSEDDAEEAADHWTTPERTGTRAGRRALHAACDAGSRRATV